MALITRFTRLFKADMHAVLDRLEEPDVLLRQAVREMEEEVTQQARLLKSRELERQQAESRLAEIRKSQQAMETELDLCFQADNEPLARTLLRRRLENERLTRHLEQRLEALRRMIAEQTVALNDQRRRLEGMRQQSAVLDSETRTEGTPRGAEPFAVSDADVDIAWLREQQKRGKAP